MTKYDGIFRFDAFDSGGAPIHLVVEVRAGNCLVLENSHVGLGRTQGCDVCMDIIERIKRRNPFKGANDDH